MSSDVVVAQETQENIKVEHLEGGVGKKASSVSASLSDLLGDAKKRLAEL